MTTPVDLRDYIERIFDERERALTITAHTLERRLDDLNHWRTAALSDREQYVQKAVQAEMHAAIVSRLETLERVQSRLQGAGIVFVGLAAVAGAVIAHLLRG